MLGNVITMKDIFHFFFPGNKNGRILTTKSIATLFQMRGQGRFKVADAKIIFHQNDISIVGKCINKRKKTDSNYHVLQKLLRKHL